MSNREPFSFNPLSPFRWFCTSSITFTFLPLSMSLLDSPHQLVSVSFHSVTHAISDYLPLTDSLWCFFFSLLFSLSFSLHFPLSLSNPLLYPNFPCPLRLLPECLFPSLSSLKHCHKGLHPFVPAEFLISLTL